MATNTAPPAGDATTDETIEPDAAPVTPLVQLLDVDTDGGVCDANGVCS